MVSDEKRDYKWLYWVIGLAVMIVIIVICYLLFRGTETYVSDTPTTQKMVAIDCMGSEQDEAFFMSDRAEDVSHVIKGTFKNNVLNQISYNYGATFANSTVADTSEAVFHGQYNKYMASKNLNPDSLRPMFSSSNNNVKITLFTDATKLSNDNIQFFFLSMDDFQYIKSYSPRELAAIYQGKGFSCEVHE